jgi:hypothetical protein
MEPGRGLPLPAEEWVEELLVRVFAILGNLEAPERGEHGAGGRPAGDGGLSFLLAGNSMFRRAAQPRSAAPLLRTIPQAAACPGAAGGCR